MNTCRTVLFRTPHSPSSSGSVLRSYFLLLTGISPDSISMDAYSNDYADALCQAAARVQRYGKFQELALSPSVMAAIGKLKKKQKKKTT